MPTMPTLVALAVLAAAVSAQQQYPTLTFTGQNTGDQFGSVVVPFHDIDNDGVVDLLVGSPTWDNGAASNAGRVELRSGRTGVLLRTNNGTNTNDNFGSAIDTLTDLNGDGVPEYLVGVPGADNGGTDSGAAKVFSGATGGLLRNHFPAENGGHAGNAVCGLPDADGDGVRDYAYGVPNNTNVTPVGRVRVVSGATGNVLYSMYGTQSAELFGATLCRVGDMGGDVRDDLAIGAPGYVSGVQSGTGRVFVVSLGATYGTALHTFDQGVAGGHLGSALAKLGDLDGDGRAEFAAAIPDIVAGRVHVYAATGALLRSHFGTLAGGRFGLGLGDLGDIDLDGVRDYGIGAPFAPLGEVSLYSGANGVLLAPRFTLGWAGSYAGRCFAAVGDADGDGYPEFAVGVPGDAAGSLRLFALQQPTRTEEFGAACGVPTLPGRLQTATSGAVGAPLQLAADMSPLGSGIGLLVLGWSKTHWGSTPLPFPLTPLGFPGCELLVALDATIAVAHTANPALILVGTPSAPSLVGDWIHAQYALFHAGGTAFSNGYSLRFGTPF